ncbi:hypothetical protein C8R47DRAFT_571500 [Mycena vitilis]|nr:hypothetical protein C8R47DRAFT_571500 [Mycena vitilis]
MQRIGHRLFLLPVHLAASLFVHQRVFQSFNYFPFPLTWHLREFFYSQLECKNTADKAPLMTSSSLYRIDCAARERRWFQSTRGRGMVELQFFFFDYVFGSKSAWRRVLTAAAKNLLSHLSIRVSVCFEGRQSAGSNDCSPNCFGSAKCRASDKINKWISQSPS